MQTFIARSVSHVGEHLSKRPRHPVGLDGLDEQAGVAALPAGLRADEAA